MATTEDLLVRVECNDVVGTIEREIDDIVRQVIGSGVDPAVSSWVRRDVETAIALNPANMLECQVVKSGDPSVCLVNVAMSDAFKYRIVVSVTRVYRKPRAV